MERPDALVAQCRNLARMEEGPTKDGMKAVALEMLCEYELAGKITPHLRVMLQRIVEGGQPPPETPTP
jgi:hypothetical protein